MNYMYMFFYVMPSKLQIPVHVLLDKPTFKKLHISATDVLKHNSSCYFMRAQHILAQIECFVEWN